MNHTVVIGPEAMEGQNKFLERHRAYNLVGRDDDLMFTSETTCQASKNAFPLSRNKPL